jgi:hypothetical protein
LFLVFCPRLGVGVRGSSTEDHLLPKPANLDTEGQGQMASHSLSATGNRSVDGAIEETSYQCQCLELDFPASGTMGRPSQNSVGNDWGCLLHWRPRLGLGPEPRHSPHSQPVMGDGPAEEATDVNADRSEGEAHFRPSPLISLQPGEWERRLEGNDAEASIYTSPVGSRSTAKPKKSS